LKSNWLDKYCLKGISRKHAEAWYRELQINQGNAAALELSEKIKFYNPGGVK